MKLIRKMSDAALTRSEKIKETIMLSVLNIALPSVDVYSDLALIDKFYFGKASRRNPWCDEHKIGYDVNAPSFYRNSVWTADRLNCHYNMCTPTTAGNVSEPPSHYTWGTMMLVPFLLNYLVCWYAWATTVISSLL